MYTDPLNLNNGTDAVVFDRRGSTPDMSVYKDNAVDLDKPHVLTIKHETRNKGKINQTRATVVRIDKTVENDQGEQGVISVYQVTLVPEKCATSTQVTEQVTLMKDFLTEAGHIGKIVSADL